MKAEPVLRVTDYPGRARDDGGPIYIHVPDYLHVDEQWARLRRMADEINAEARRLGVSEEPKE